MKFLLPVVLLLSGYRTLAQAQVCPLNSNFSEGTLNDWNAYTGNNNGGNGPNAIKLRYDSLTAAASGGTLGATSIQEYQLPSTLGIQVVNSNTVDYLGGFPTVPTINGYKYTSSVKLGSTAITRSNSTGVSGGYVRGITYRIAVPAGSSTVPYTMTYAYAMVLENGTHNSDQQPLFSATLTHNGTVISCASPKYFLPTRDNADDRGTGATLDTALAVSEGFYLSAHPSPNTNPNSNSPNAGYLMDVWAKSWTEVTFDLSAYRGDYVELTFETDNCVPGGHFAYSYVALRNDCGGLIISGAEVACIGSTLTYSIPGLTSASYQWSIPSGWSIVSGADSNILKVKVGPNGGTITAFEQNSCASLSNLLNVTTTPPTVAGYLANDNEVCTGNNSSPIILSGNVGSVLNWLTSTNGGLTYSSLPVTTTSYTAQNLSTTTIYRALVQNGSSCDIDTSTAATILVDPMSVGGKLNPSAMIFCEGQNKDAKIILSGNTGTVQNWQSTPDGAGTWTDFAPAYQGTEYDVVGMTASTDYRVVVKSGVCPADISSATTVSLLNVPFPQASAEPTDTTICYNDSAHLNVSITLGTSYTWTNTTTLHDEGPGDVSYVPYNINAIAHPLTTSFYVLSVVNTGCPNPLLDTLTVHVIPPIIVDAGHDTSIVFNEPLQLHASSNDTTGDIFSWSPVTGLNNPNSSDPIAILGPFIDSVRYTVKATSELGCFGLASILVKVFKTNPEIFVPNAFTPGGTANNVFRPIPVGIATFQYFRVYNRWGQLVYSTTATGQGWDGRVNGTLQPAGGYVWMVQGISYTGKVVFKKGTMVLIR